jgi:hypothetical protein
VFKQIETAVIYYCSFNLGPSKKWKQARDQVHFREWLHVDATSTKVCLYDLEPHCLALGVCCIDSQ